MTDEELFAELAATKQRMIQRYVEMVRLRQYCLTKFGKAPEIPTPEEIGLTLVDVDFGAAGAMLS
jgi:hypothetical protein